MFVPIKDLLSKKNSRENSIALFDERQIVFVFSKIIEELMNQKAARFARVIYLQNKVLVVAVPSSAWACQLQFLQGKIIQKINSLIKEKIVERIVFKVMG